MRTLILIWVALFPFAFISQAQRDVRGMEKQSNQLEKQRKDLLQVQNKIAITYDKNFQGEYVFTCRNNAFCREHPATVITKEMSKKEVKKWSENHKSS